jgi:uncharacterized membrane protein YhaH (DUF805 family)
MKAKVSSRLFSGRLGRLGYLMGVLYGLAFTAASAVLVAIIIALINQSSPDYAVTQTTAPSAQFVAIGWFIAMMIFAIFINASLQIRRWHDLGLSGWMTLLSFFPFTSFIVLVVIFVVPGSASANRYGQPQSGKLNLASIFGFKRRQP